MRKLLTLWIALAAIVFAVCSPVSAQGFNGGCFNCGCPACTGGGGAYTGPGNIVSGASAWWGLRAYNTAYATALGNIANIVDTATGAATCTIKANASGDADLTTAGAGGAGNNCLLGATTFCTTTHAAGCSVTLLYDQLATAFI
jgi:hypothetical protein